MMNKIILASKSPYRKQLLSRLGVPFETANSEFDEGPLKLTIKDPQELTRQLSVAKAKAIAKSNPGCIVIGSDQVCHFQGEIFGKPGTIVGAQNQLNQLQGQIHELITSYAIILDEKEIISTNITKLKMRKLTTEQVKNYLSTDNPIDCAGAYKLELNGISLMEYIDTEDYTSIIGLPLISLANDLNQMGILIPPEN